MVAIRLNLTCAGQHWDRVYPIHVEMKKRTRRVVFILQFRIGMKSELSVTGKLFHEGILLLLNNIGILIVL